MRVSHGGKRNFSFVIRAIMRENGNPTREILSGVIRASRHRGEGAYGRCQNCCIPFDLDPTTRQGQLFLHLRFLYGERDSLSPMVIPRRTDLTGCMDRPQNDAAHSIQWETYLVPLDRIKLTGLKGEALADLLGKLEEKMPWLTSGFEKVALSAENRRAWLAAMKGLRKFPAVLQEQIEADKAYQFSLWPGKRSSNHNGAHVKGGVPAGIEEATFSNAPETEIPLWLSQAPQESIPESLRQILAEVS